MKVTQSILLDFGKDTVPITVFAKQYDTKSRFLEITPLNKGQNYILESGTTARLQLTKPDGTTVINDAVIEDGIITAELTQQALAAAGTAIAEIGLYTGETFLSSQIFYIEIEKAAYNPDAPESSDEYNSLVEALEKADEVIERAETAAEAAEEAVENFGTIDQTYNPESTRAQSGTAVAEAIEQKPGKKTSGGGEIFNNLSSNSAAGEFSHTEGSNNKVATPSGGSDVPSGADIGEFDKGTATHIEGMFNTGDGVGSHIEGLFNKASENGSHTEGVKNTNNGKGTHVEGGTNEASGDYAHVEGAFNYGYGNYSHAGGTGNITRGTAQTIIGKYAEEGKNDNAKPSEKQLFAVGNGTAPDNRSNALALYESGKLEVNNDTVYPNGDQAQMFLRGVCIGDSLTEGMYNNDGAQFFKKGKTYPDYLKKLMPDTQLTNAGFTGDTAMQWWIHSANTLWVNNEYDRGAVQQDKRAVFSWDCNGLGYDFAVIELGVNDGLQTGKTSEEIVSEFKEAMGNICNKLIASNAGIKIFIANIIPLFHRSLEIYITLNQAIEEICSAKGAYLIDLTASSEITYDSDYNCGGHPSAAGYQKLAKEIYSLVCTAIRANAEDFTEEQLADVSLEAPREQDKFADVENIQSGVKLNLINYASKLELSNTDDEPIFLLGINGFDSLEYADDDMAVNAKLLGIELNKAKFDNKQYADNTFSNVLKGNKNGEAFLLNDVSPASHNMELNIRSKNLIPFPYIASTTTMNGVTFTVNEDGSILVNGTAQYDAQFNLFSGALEETGIDTVKGATYTLSGCPSGGSASSYFLRVHTGEHTFQDIGTGYTNVTSEESSTSDYAYITVKKGTTANNLLFKPQLELGSTATAYAPYISDLTDVKVMKLGKNLFDKDNPNKINGYFSADGDSISPAPTTRSIYLACKPNTAYTASKITSARFALGFTSEVPAGGVEVNGVAFSNSGATTLTSTSPADAKYLVVWFYHQTYDTGITEDEIMNTIQVELGSAATEYEAYIPAVKYTPESDGTVDGVMSLYPNTTLMTDTAGAIIDCGYNRDINKAYGSLLQRVAALEAAALNNV